ncbi:MAG: glycerol-3-phosphate 1-O-acyltransferase PlsY [Proteobacteria bacterium]|nr:glycerol-3-phosphate 1-O-acyltransferase PlsY [Pseudomonadota bacterium]
MISFFTVNEWIILAIGVVSAYLIGSISSAILICRLFSLPDPRLEGSKNPGTTNVLRIGGKLPAALTLLCDVAKGVIPVLGVKFFSDNPWIIGAVMLAAVFGHLFPLFFAFKGGKGVATTIGALFALSPYLGGIFIFTWLGIFALSRYSSLSALIATISMPAFAYGFLDERYMPALMLLALVIVIKHKDNVVRLLTGKETKSTFKKSA